jgi:CubicO group peptidase (beta-lactamase class C family)
LAAIDARLPPEAIADWPTVVAALAAQAPNWPPGSAHGYHAMTFGWLIGELVRRRSGKRFGEFFQSEIARPLGLEFWIGLPEPYESRLSRLRMAPPVREASRQLKAMFDRESLTARAFLNPRSMLMPGAANARETHAAEIPAANGITSAVSLARLYAAMLGDIDGFDGLSSATLAALAHAESDGDDLVLLLPTRFTGGYMKSVDNRPDSSLRMGPNSEAFGHPGAGGSLGMADPVAGVAIGYVMNQLGHGVLLNERGHAILEAVYASLNR